MTAEHDRIETGPFKGWRFDRHISVGHVVTTLVVAVTAMAWLNSLEKRISLAENAIVVQVDRVNRLEDRQDRTIAEMKSEVRAGFETLRQDIRGLVDRLDRARERDAK